MQRSHKSYWKSFFILGLLLLALVVVLAGSVYVSEAATTITVNTTIDDKKASDGFCTLREAIIAANSDKSSGNRRGECPAGSGDDTIILPAGTYVLSRADNGNEDAATTGDLDFASNIVLEGAGADVTVIDASAITDRAVHVLSGNVTISGVTIRGGVVKDNGGGIFNATQLTLNAVSASGNSASTGGGIYNSVTGNITMTASTVAANTAAGSGSGIYNAGTFSATNSTISGNNLFSSGSVNLESATVTGSTSGNLSAHNTILSGTCSGAVSSAGYNLISDATGCTISGVQTGNIVGQPARLSRLDYYGGPTRTHALEITSPALEAGPAKQDAATACEPFDQRGIARPQGNACDIGAYEETNLPQKPPLVVNTDLDENNPDGLCSYEHCSLREAISFANSLPGLTKVGFDIPGDAPVLINLVSPLPTITQPIDLDGTKEFDGFVTIDGTNAGPGANGLTIEAGGSTVQGIVFVNFDGNGILLTGAGGNTITGSSFANNGGDGIRIEGDGANTISNNTITGNGGSGIFIAGTPENSSDGNNVIAGNEIANNTGNGITVVESVDNQLDGNNIYDNGGLSIDLGNDGPTENDPGDLDSGANNVQNYPVLLSATTDPANGKLTVVGYLNSIADTTYAVEFFAGAECTVFGGGSQTLVGSANVTIPAGEETFTFTATNLAAVQDGQFITATATDPNGNTSELSDCIVAGPNNIAWPNAIEINPQPNLGAAAIQQYLIRQGESRWYKFDAPPNSQLIFTLTNLPRDYNLTIYRDILGTYNSLQNPTLNELEQLGLEFAPEAFSPEAFSPEAFSPEAFSPEAFSPEAFSPEAFSPEAFSPEAFSPEAFSPEAFSPEAFSATSYAPEAFSPEAFSPEAFSPEAFSPEAFSPEAFSSAQMRSLIGVSAARGVASEGLRLNSWGNRTFYVRVTGANGTFDLQNKFALSVSVISNECENVLPLEDLTTATTPAPTTNPTTLILTDWGRMSGDTSSLQNLVSTFAARPDVQGHVVDLGQVQRVSDANAQANLKPTCPYAKNQVAEAVDDLIDAYWDQDGSNLQYVVILGNDHVVPFFRYPDLALLANENNYVPPVLDATASQASLRLGYILGQDEYGARTSVAFKSSNIPVPELGVGRLVEDPTEISAVLQAFIDGSGTLTPQSVLVTGYDGLEDGALAVKDELLAGIGSGAISQELITPRSEPPTSPQAWTADDLRNALLNPAQPVDVAFLGGHFSQGGALAADYRTRMAASEVANSDLDLSNMLVYSAGCHSGYNTVDTHLTGITEQPDWAQAFNGKGATLIAGTGYQYFDTLFLEYSERLYLEFSRELRTGSNPVAIGAALSQAKQDYLSGTPQMRGIHQKVLLQSTLFGLPMLKVDMANGQRLNNDNSTSIVPEAGTTAFTTTPGSSLGLSYFDFTLNPTLTQKLVQLTDVTTGTNVEATYFSGSDGELSLPGEPILPLEKDNVTVPNQVLRGIGFRGGSYQDLLDILPLTGAPATEVRGVHAEVALDYFYPIQLWRANYYDALTNGGTGSDATLLYTTPAQFKSSFPGSQTGILRRFNSIDYRLYYSSETGTYAGNSVPALAAPPTIANVTVTPNGDGTVTISTIAVGDPAAGIQEVWALYTGVTGNFYGQWHLLELAQDDIDPSLWQATLALNGTDPADLRLIMQAVNGVGLVSLAANLGDTYGVGGGDPALTEMTIVDVQPAAKGPYGTTVAVTAKLTSGGSPVAGRLITASVGQLGRSGVTDANGQATINVTLGSLPGTYGLRASFGGDVSYGPSSAEQIFTIEKQGTALTLVPANLTAYAGNPVSLTAVLQDLGGTYLVQQTVFFKLTGNNGVSLERAVITDFAGRALLDGLGSLAEGTYDVEATYNSNDRYTGTSTTGTLTIKVNQPPDCTQAKGSEKNAWPPNSRLVPVTILGITDPDGDPITITITAIRQDEATGFDSNSPDGFGVGTDTALLRAERDGNGDGRVYHLYYTASDGKGGTCGVSWNPVTREPGLKLPIVPNNQGNLDKIDQGPLYDSTVQN